MLFPEAFQQEENLNIITPYKLFFAPPFYPMWPHFHSQIELMFFYDEVDCTYICGGTPYGIHAGDLVVVNTNQVHMCDYTSSSARIGCIIVMKKFFAMQSAPINCVFQNHISGDKVISEIFEAIFMHFLRNDKTAQLDITSCLCQLFSRLMKFYSNESSDAARQADKLKAVEKIRPAIRYILRNFSQSISLHELSSVCGLSYYRFCHIFSEIMGVSPVSYITDIRISHACTLLLESDLDIAVIAGDCGFCSPAYFSEQFKKATGMAPREYRKRA
jgi:AraC-like DNA-binding protein